MVEKRKAPAKAAKAPKAAQKNKAKAPAKNTQAKAVKTAKPASRVAQSAVKKPVVPTAKKAPLTSPTAFLGLDAPLMPTSYTEVSRVHRSATSNLNGSLVVTASRHGEGTSLLAHVLAIRSAEAGQKTVLIDLNLRNRGLTQSLGFTAQAWQLAQRERDDTLKDLIQTLSSVENLSFMPAPSDDGSVKFLKDVRRARAFLDTLEKQFDHVVIDTTPVSALNRLNADPVMLAAAANRTTVVMLSNQTPRDAVEQTLKTLHDAGAHVEGLVMNDWKNPSQKEKLLRFIEGFAGVAPGLHAWLKHKILHTEF